MLTLKTLLLTALSTTSLALSSPSSPAVSLTQRSTPVGTGSHSGFFYSFWSDGIGNISYTNLPSGSYSVFWLNCNNFFAGKGWNPGRSDRNITFDAAFNTTGNGYLSVYGWAKDPKVEYYIVENWGTFNPASLFGGVANGKTIEVDGGRYTVGVYRRVNMNLGAPVLTQVYSVRDAEDRRVKGTVDVGKHMEAWRGLLGVNLGALEYQIVATEGYQSSGEAEVTVYE
jgi:endo-1,4-beta-xylanase